MLEVNPLFRGSYFFDNLHVPMRVVVTEESPYLMRHHHDFVEIAYVLDGEGLHYISDQIIKVSSGDLFIIPAGESHVFQPQYLTGKRTLRIINFLYDPAGMGVSELQLEQQWRHYHDQNRIFKQVFLDMYAQQAGLNSMNQVMTSKWLNLLELLHKNKETTRNLACGIGDIPIHKAVQFMGSHFRNPLKIKEISNLVALSPRHFQRLFKAMTGRSFIQMLQEIRIQVSCGMLSHTNWNIQDIATSVGLQDMSYFYRLFREYSGMSPKTYRLGCFKSIQY